MYSGILLPGEETQLPVPYDQPIYLLKPLQGRVLWCCGASTSGCRSTVHASKGTGSPVPSVENFHFNLSSNLRWAYLIKQKSGIVVGKVRLLTLAGSDPEPNQPNAASMLRRLGFTPVS